MKLKFGVIINNYPPPPKCLLGIHGSGGVGGPRIRYQDFCKIFHLIHNSSKKTHAHFLTKGEGVRKCFPRKYQIMLQENTRSCSRKILNPSLGKYQILLQENTKSFSRNLLVKCQILFQENTKSFGSILLKDF